METRDVLIKARELIATPERWTRGLFARDVDGYASRPCGKAATCFCMVGATMAASNANHVAQVPHEVRLALAGAIDVDPNQVTYWNDAPERTHAEVLAAFDRAIAACEVAS